MEMSGCLLCEKDLPKKLWIEATNEVGFFYLYLLPTKFVKEYKRFEESYEYNPSLQNIVIFFVCSSHIFHGLRGKG